MEQNKTDKTVAIFPGSFNPFTIGHKAILMKALPLFDKVVVAIGINDSKKVKEEDVENRRLQIARALQDIPNVEVIAFKGLTVETAKKFNARYIIRGIRDVKDYEYERNLADVNRAIAGIETILLPAPPDVAWISSSILRELEGYGFDITQYLP